MEENLVVNSQVITSSIYIQQLANNSIPDYSFGVPEPIELHFHVNKVSIQTFEYQINI